jgi:hypothetical protein
MTVAVFPLARIPEIRKFFFDPWIFYALFALRRSSFRARTRSMRSACLRLNVTADRARAQFADGSSIKRKESTMASTRTRSRAPSRSKPSRAVSSQGSCTHHHDDPSIHPHIAIGNRCELHFFFFFFSFSFFLFLFFFFFFSFSFFLFLFLHFSLPFPKSNIICIAGELQVPQIVHAASTEG